MGKQWKQCQTLFFWAPKSLQMVTAAMKLKDTYSLEEKLWPTYIAYSKAETLPCQKSPSSQGYGFSCGSVWMWELDYEEGWTPKNDAFELWCWRRLLSVLELQRDPTSVFWRRSALGFLWREWCWSWNSSTLATSCEELTHLKKFWCWEGFGAGEEGDDRGWGGWMASLTRWTWVWVNSGSWWWTRRPGVLQFMGSQRVGCNWATELNWM